MASKSISTILLLVCNIVMFPILSQAFMASTSLTPVNVKPASSRLYMSTVTTRRPPTKGSGTGMTPPAYKKGLDSDACPCSSGLRYFECCQQYHYGEEIPTMEKLLRSRFSAYAKALPEFVMDTTDESNSEYRGDPVGRKQWKKSIERFCDQYRFEGLNVNGVEVIDDDNGWIEFEANLGEGKMTKFAFNERSLFQRKNGKWMYVKADLGYQPKLRRREEEEEKLKQEMEEEENKLKAQEE